MERAFSWRQSMHGRHEPFFFLTRVIGKEYGLHDGSIQPRDSNEFTFSSIMACMAGFLWAYLIFISKSPFITILCVAAVERPWICWNLGSSVSQNFLIRTGNESSSEWSILWKLLEEFRISCSHTWINGSSPSGNSRAWDSPIVLS